MQTLQGLHRSASRRTCLRTGPACPLKVSCRHSVNAIPACGSWILRRITCGLCHADPMCQGFGSQKVQVLAIQKIYKTATAPACQGRDRAVYHRQDASGTVPSSAKRSDSANPSASYPACPAMERPSTSKSAIRVIGLAVVESPKARCSTSNIS